MALSKSQIWEAAERLSKQGRKPTLAALREAVGGSYSTLSPALREWKQRRGERPEDGGGPMPEAVERRAREAGSAIWAVAAAAARERLSGERAALRRERETAAEELAEATRLADEATDEAARLRQRCGRLEASLEKAEGALAEARSEARESVAQARSGELAAREEAARLGGALTAHQQQLAGLLARLPAARDAG